MVDYNKVYKELTALRQQKYPHLKVIFFLYIFEKLGKFEEFFLMHFLLKQIIASSWARSFLKDYVNNTNHHPNNNDQRRIFIENVTNFISKHKFDGLDLFWDDLEQT